MTKESGYLGQKHFKQREHSEQKLQGRIVYATLKVHSGAVTDQIR